ncbi:hypothetical protein B0H63DRAFT_446304 [Podospora didyma]|uniref:Heterokaryon incompatibility domain-containing protein n=1 Tax=Podospora didyma TaxID=330526 RepID=A0AAE0U4G5_9PEZI|nr:hypothetical protein B0H63DRAFT_446304 [Podospora didyma]
MGIRYLWIDSLCIVQDDQDDWRKQAADMSQLIDNAPLLSRGWAFQERILSPRVLHFGANELVWECMEGLACQCDPRSPQGGIKASLGSILRAGPSMGGGTTKLTAAMHWLNLVNQYGGLSLTFWDDKLAAISGLAKRTLQFDEGDQYVAGFWKGDLPHGLAWCCDKTPPNARPTTWTAPTWSWASIDSRGTFIHFGQSPHWIYATVEQTECFLVGPDPTGQIVYAQMIVSGPAAGVELNYDESIIRDTSVISRHKNGYQVFLGLEPVGMFWPDYALGAEDKGHIASGSGLICLLVYEYNRTFGECPNRILVVSEYPLYMPK